MPPGTLVVSKPLSPSRIAIGDVITYQVRSGKPAVVTHRVVAVGVGVHGPVFRTQGDANNTPDKDWVRPVQVRGERWYYVPYLGYVTSLITSGQRQVITVLIESVLVVYAAVEFGTALLDRLRRRRKVAL
jgi:signal peptidase